MHKNFPVFPRQLTCLAFGACLLFAVSCTVAELAYSFADRLILHEISEQYGLSNAQEIRVLSGIQERLYQHQQEELPLYEEWLKDARQAISDQLTRDELKALNERAEKFLQRGVRKTLPLFANILTDLTPDQIAYMREETLEDYSERAEEIAERGADWAQTKRAKKVLERLEEWLGKLSDSQRKLVKQEVASWPYNTERWLAWRKQRFLSLVDFLQTNPSSQKTQNYLDSHWVQYETMPESLAKSWRQSRQNYLELVLKLDKTLSAEQRRQVIKKLDEWLTIVRSMQAEDIKPENT